MNISGVLSEVFEEFTIKPERRFLLIRDGASNMIAATNLANIDSIHCTLHLLQLAINDSLKSQRTVCDVIAKCRKICTHFHHSPKAVEFLKSIQREQNADDTNPYVWWKNIGSYSSSPI